MVEQSNKMDGETQPQEKPTRVVVPVEGTTTIVFGSTLNLQIHLLVGISKK